MNLIYLSNDPRGFIYQVLSLFEDRNINVFNNTHKGIMVTKENLTAKNIVALDDKKKEKALIGEFFLEDNDLSILALPFDDFKELVKQDYFKLSVEAIDGLIVDFEDDTEVSIFNFLHTTQDLIRTFLRHNKIFFRLKNKNPNAIENEIEDMEDYLNFFTFTTTSFIENLSFLEDISPICKNVTLKRFDDERKSILNKSVSPTEKDNLIEKYTTILSKIRSGEITDKNKKDELKKEAFEIIEELRMIDKLSFYKSLIAFEFNNFKNFISKKDEKDFEKVEVSVETRD